MRQHALYFSEEIEPRHVRHHQIGEDHLWSFGFQPRQRNFSALGLRAIQSKGGAYRYTKLTNALLVIHDHEMKLFVAHYCPLPATNISTLLSSWPTRNGFSMHGAPVCCRIAMV